MVAAGARREAAGDRDRALDAHVRHIGVLSGRRDLAEDEERPIGVDLDRHRRFADEAIAQPCADRAARPAGVLPRAGTAPISGMVIEPPASIA